MHTGKVAYKKGKKKRKSISYSFIAFYKHDNLVQKSVLNISVDISPSETVNNEWQLFN